MPVFDPQTITKPSPCEIAISGDHAMSSSSSKYLIQPFHDVLSVRLSGTWNAEDTMQFSGDFKRQVSRYFAREWACVLNLKELELLVPDAYQVHAFRALNTWSYIKGMQAMAILFSPDSRSALLYQFEEILDDRQPYQRLLGQSEAEAHRWLAELGFRDRKENQLQRFA
jgi:hypothetical protein